MCLKLTIKTPERGYQRRFGTIILLILDIFHIFFSVSIVDFKQVNVSWVKSLALCLSPFYFFYFFSTKDQ